MRFFWKVYFSFTVLLLLAFGSFGTWMIQLTFEKSYQRVLKELERENRMFQLSFEMNLNTLDEIYQDDSMIPATAASITENLADSGSIFRIYNEEQQLLYENRNYQTFDDELRHTLEQQQIPCGYQLFRIEKNTYLLFACRSMIGSHVYYLENVPQLLFETLLRSCCLEEVIRLS